jgi:tRNA 2-selenouridine synthase
VKLLKGQFESLFLKSRPWIDVRAPVEFQVGHIPEAVNLPLLTDHERHEIGLRYKQQGPESAIALGHELVSGEVRKARTEAWAKAVENNPDAVIYCFRGGMRSQITQSWLQERGIDRPIIDGGYKELRGYLLEVLTERIESMQFQVISGLTGSGKTAYIRASGCPFVDLEGLAAHRGSAFGAMERPQPTQTNFENAMAVQLIRLSLVKEPILIEHESRMIGQRTVPAALLAKIVSSPQIVVEISFEQRVENILVDYVIKPCETTPSGADVFSKLSGSVKAISRKLGGARTQEILTDLNLAEAEFDAGMGFEANRVWIRKLLEWYYDPMYRHSLSSESD